jgi:PAS domain-containing protein
VVVRDSEFDFVFHDGRVRYLFGNAVLLRDGRGSVLGSVGVFIDITGCKRAKTSLAQSETRFRHLTNALPQMVFDLDAEKRSGYFNEQWLRYTERETKNVKTRITLVHPDDRARMAEN